MKIVPENQTNSSLDITLSNKCHCCVAVHDIFDFVARYTDA